MACTTGRSQEIGDLVTGRLASEPALELLDHLETCADCSRELDLAAELVAAGEGAESPALEPARARFDWRPSAVAAALLVAVGLWSLARLGEPTADELLVRLAAVEPLPGSTAELRAPSPATRGPWWDAAMTAYEVGDLTAVAEALAPRTLEHPEDALLHLYLGIALLEAGEPHAAAAALEVAARHGEGLLEEQALWYLGHAWLAARDRSAATRTFEQLAALAGDYELDARDKLEALRALED